MGEDDGVVARDEAAQVRHDDFDHEVSTRLKVGSGVREARDLPVLGHLERGAGAGRAGQKVKGRSSTSGEPMAPSVSS